MVATAFVQEFQNFIDSEGYLPQQVFNCDETRIFWKVMPEQRTYITAEEKSLPGHKSMKDRQTLMLCANARVFKRNNVQKDNLPVM